VDRIIAPSVPGLRPKGARRWRTGLLLLGLAGLVLLGLAPRLRAREALRRDTAALSILTVSVTQPKRSTAAPELVLPASVRGVLDAPIFARTSGYLKRWYFDIGARVKQGQLLAEIETPEVDQQLLQARADLATARANVDLARTTANRFASLRASGAVAQQDVDNSAGDLASKTTLVQSSEAAVKRLEQLVSFEKVYAPFDGVITARNTDVGALIDSGASGGPRAELFHIAQPERLRVFVNVPQIDAPVATPGLAVDLTVAELPGQRFPGTLVRTARAIDPTTRTLVAEIEVDNASGTLLPGAFAQVHLKLPQATDAFLVPVSALMFRAEGLRVAVVGSDDKVVLTPLRIARDLGNAVEVSAGLTGNEAIIDNPPDSLLAGQVVRVAPAVQSAAPASVQNASAKAR
jgi:RND family efflux transporter MFP subunit